MISCGHSNHLMGAWVRTTCRTWLPLSTRWSDYVFLWGVFFRTHSASACFSYPDCRDRLDEASQWSIYQTMCFWHALCLDVHLYAEFIDLPILWGTISRNTSVLFRQNVVYEQSLVEESKSKSRNFPESGTYVRTLFMFVKQSIAFKQRHLDTSFYVLQKTECR